MMLPVTYCKFMFWPIMLHKIRKKKQVQRWCSKTLRASCDNDDLLIKTIHLQGSISNWTEVSPPLCAEVKLRLFSNHILDNSVFSWSWNVFNFTLMSCFLFQAFCLSTAGVSVQTITLFWQKHSIILEEKTEGLIISVINGK